MRRPVVALVTARAARGLDEDQPPLEVALQAAGATVAIADWDDPAVDWRAFDLALLRSTWDYTERRLEFLAWAERVSGLTQLANPAPVVRWNTDKHYLAELAGGGVPTVPGTFIEPGQNEAAALERFIATLETQEWVVKPAVGAGSKDTERYRRSARESAVAHAKRLLRAGRSVLLQPYLERVDEYGETALIFFEGRFSHAVRKGPMLPPAQAEPPPAAGPATGGAAAAANNALFVSEQITPRTAADDELRVAAAALRAMPFKLPLYARVDLIGDAAGAPVVLELELTEPSLFFAHAAGAADRFAQTVLGHIPLPFNT